MPLAYNPDNNRESTDIIFVFKRENLFELVTFLCVEIVCTYGAILYTYTIINVMHNIM